MAVGSGPTLIGEPTLPVATVMGMTIPVDPGVCAMATYAVTPSGDGDGSQGGRPPPRQRDLRLDRPAAQVDHRHGARVGVGHVGGAPVRGDREGGGRVADRDRGAEDGGLQIERLEGAVAEGDVGGGVGGRRRGSRGGSRRGRGGGGRRDGGGRDGGGHARRRHGEARRGERLDGLRAGGGGGGARAGRGRGAAGAYRQCRGAGEHAQGNPAMPAASGRHRNRATVDRRSHGRSPTVSGDGMLRACCHSRQKLPQEGRNAIETGSPSRAIAALAWSVPTLVATTPWIGEVPAV